MNTRGKLLAVWGVVALGLVLTLLVITTRMIALQQPAAVRLGTAQEFPVGSLVLFTCDRAAQRCEQLADSSALITDRRFYDADLAQSRTAWVWLAHASPEQWNAFLAVSPHHGCFVDWKQERTRFEEGCYGSIWQRDGSYLFGPTPRGLDSFPLRIQDGSVRMDWNVVRGQPHE